MRNKSQAKLASIPEIYLDIQDISFDQLKKDFDYIKVGADEASTSKNLPLSTLLFFIVSVRTLISLYTIWGNGYICKKYNKDDRRKIRNLSRKLVKTYNELTAVYRDGSYTSITMDELPNISDEMNENRFNRSFITSPDENLDKTNVEEYDYLRKKIELEQRNLRNSELPDLSPYKVFPAKGNNHFSLGSAKFG